MPRGGDDLVGRQVGICAHAGAHACRNRFYPLVREPAADGIRAAETANELSLTDITEHQTAEGKLYLCAINDAFSGRIVGYSIDSRMKSRLAVQALKNAVAMRGGVVGCVVHSDCGSVPKQEDDPRPDPPSHGRKHGQSRLQRRQRGHGNVFALLQKNVPDGP